jgi:P27 family predicted phage terminase small subunit
MCRPYRPRELSRHKGACRIWDYLAPILERMGTLSTADREPLARYCILVSQFYKAAEFVETHGRTVEYTHFSESGSSTTYATHPEVAHMVRFGSECSKLERMLGITASARAGLAGNMGVKEQRKTRAEELAHKYGS